MKFFSRDKNKNEKNAQRKLSNISDENSPRDSLEIDSSISQQVPQEERVPFQEFVSIDIRLRIPDVETRLFHRTVNRYTFNFQIRNENSYQIASNTNESIISIQLLRIIAKNLTVFNHQQAFFNCQQRYTIEIQSEGFPTKTVQRKSSDFEGLHNLVSLLFTNIDLPDFPRKMNILSKKKRMETFETLLMKIVEESNQTPSPQTRIKLRKILYNFLYANQTQTQEDNLEVNRSPSKQESKNNSILGLEQQDNEERVELQDSEFQLNLDRDDRRSKSYFSAENTGEFQVREDRNASFQGLHVVKLGKEENNLETIEINQKQEQIKDQIDYFNKLDQSKEKSNQGGYLHILQRKDSMADEIKKEGYFYLNLQGEKQWKKYFLKICAQNILIYSLNSQNQFEYCIPCISLQVKKSMDKNQEIITLGHRYDMYQIAVKQADDSKDANKKTTSSEDFYKTYQELKQCADNCHKTLKQKPTGKLLFEIKEAKIPKGVKIENSTFHVIIKHQNVKVHSYKKQVFDNTIQWGQKVMLPIFDNYSEIEVELYRSYTYGMLMTSNKEELVGCSTIKIADILQNIYHYQTFYLENHLKQQSKQNQLAAAQGYQQNDDLKMKLSYFARNNGEKYENQILSKDKYTPKERLEFKVTKNRIKRLKTHLIFKFNNFSEILNFKYPRISWIFYIFCILFALIFNMNYLFVYVLLFFVLTTLFNHEEFMKQMSAKMRKYETFFSKQNIDYYEQEIVTIQEYEQRKMLDSNQVTVIELEGIISKMKKYYKYLGYLNYIAFHVISFVEKAKNLITWYHYQKTYMSIIFSLIAIIVYTVLPFNIIFAAIIVKRCMKGRKYYMHAKLHNQSLVKSFIQDIIKKFFPEYTENIKYPDREWSQNCYTFPSLNKKVVEQVTQHLKFRVRDDLLSQYKTMNSLSTYLSRTHHIIYLSKALISKEYSNLQDKEKFIKKRSIIQKIFSHIYYFFYNIPSDYYRVINPQQY